MTGAAANVPGLDAAAVTAWIRGLGVTTAERLGFTRVGGGQSNLTYAVEDGSGGRGILRRPPRGARRASAHPVTPEHRLLPRGQATDVPAPRVHGLCTDPQVSDVPLLLMDHVDGLVVDTVAVARALEPAQRRAIGLALPETLGRIHAVDLERAGLADLASRTPYAERQLRRWHAQWERSRTRELPLVDEIARRLRRNVPAPGAIGLVHGDFHLLNVITDPLAGAIAAVLDWELCTLGEPLADLGTLLAYWTKEGDPAEAPFAAPALSGFPSREELVDAYAASTGRSVADVAFWHALGLWKVAIIAEGVLHRVGDDPRNQAAGVRLTARTPEDLLVRAAWIADRSGL